MEDVKLDFDDVMLVPQFTDVTSRKQVSLFTDIKGNWGQTLSGIPIIAANMHGVGTFDMARALFRFGLFTAIQKNTPVKEWLEFCEKEQGNIWYTIDGLGSNRRVTPSESVFITLGMDQPDFNRPDFHGENLYKLRMLIAAKCFRQVKIVIDVANGYMNPFYDYIKQVREIAPDAFILAGTVCTPDAVERIIESGADVARVGIGTGAVCTTRLVAGVGYPQASAIAECSMVGEVECDGGCTHPADFAKAFALGASMVMAGSVFAGHVEGGVLPDANGMVKFFGSSSHEAQDVEGTYKTSEGRVVSIPFKGKVETTVQHILGGLRSACAYSNAKTLGDLHEKAQFIRVNNQVNRSLEKYTI